MEKAAFEKYLKERYNDQMEYYDRKSGFYQNRYKKFQWILIVLSALTPIIAAFQGSKLFGEGDFKVFGENLNIIVVIISAIVAILTTGLKSFQYQELWVTYRLTQELLKPEIYYYQFNVGPYADASIDKESLFVTRVETILDKEHSSWPPAKKLKDNDGKGDQVVVDPNTIKSATTIATAETTVETTTTSTTQTATESTATVEGTENSSTAGSSTTEATGAVTGEEGAKPTSEGESGATPPPIEGGK